MTSRQRNRVEALERRRDFLAERIRNYNRGGDPSRDRAELGAIVWALHLIRAAEAEDVLLYLERIPA